MTVHARCSPSGADRWSTCTASVALIDKLRGEGVIPQEDTSEYAAEGTVAHAVREMCLEFGLEPCHFVGMVMSVDGFTFTVDDDMAEHLQPGIDWVRQHTDNPFVEVKVDLSPWLPGQFGYCDTGWIENSVERVLTLTISDLKYGAGEPVDAVGNKQLRHYALGFWNTIGRPAVERIHMNIDQPRAGGMKHWEITLDELLAFGEEMKAIFAKILAGDVEFQPSAKGCRWCPVKDAPGGCAARNKWLLDMFVDEFDDLEGDEPKLIEGLSITPARRWHIVKHAPDIRAWLAKLHEESLAAAINGNPDPGSKAVEGDLGNRYFTDEKKAEQLLVAALGDEAYQPRKLIGITDIEKKVKPGKKKVGHPETWDALQTLVDRPAGKPKLVPEDHIKPAMKSLADAFDDLD